MCYSFILESKTSETESTGYMYLKYFSTSFLDYRGLTPADSDAYFLDNASKMALYGVDLYTVKDSANNEVNYTYA